jgi:glutamine amidotransferase
MVAIIKYNAGNIASVKNAVERLGFDCVITEDINKIQNANKVIFPGVGEAKSAMNHLTNNGLSGCIKSLLQPTLGICLGLQLLCQYSEEGDTECLKIFETSVKKIPADDIVPHMGWNNISINTEPLFKGLNKDDAVYFLHSYYAGICEQTIATCNYILPFSAAMRKDNFYATQFHPEKSGDVGELILKNFLEL